jgi:hypothetical protein
MPARKKKAAAKAAAQPKTNPAPKKGLTVPFDPLIHRRVVNPRDGSTRIVPR